MGREGEWDMGSSTQGNSELGLQAVPTSPVGWEAAGNSPALEARLEQGGMGTVWEADDLDIEDEVLGTRVICPVEGDLGADQDMSVREQIEDTVENWGECDNHDPHSYTVMDGESPQAVLISGVPDVNPLRTTWTITVAHRYGLVEWFECTYHFEGGKYSHREWEQIQSINRTR